MNKTAIITGATGDIGQAIAKKLAKEGYDLFLIGNTNKDKLDELIDSLRTDAKEIHFIEDDNDEVVEAENSEENLDVNYSNEFTFSYEDNEEKDEATNQTFPKIEQDPKTNAISFYQYTNDRIHGRDVAKRSYFSQTITSYPEETYKPEKKEEKYHWTTNKMGHPTLIKVAGDLVDLTDSSGTKKLLEDATEFLENVDLLINCAGISSYGLINDVSDDEWYKIINTNLSSVFFTSRGIIPHMVNNKAGSIINISSVWGTKGASCEAIYSASKGGVDTLTKSLAKELAPSNISVNALSLGMIDTKMNDRFSAKEKAAICEDIPFGRMGSPDEVADTVYLLAQMPSYLTGQIITMDGGWI